MQEQPDRVHARALSWLASQSRCRGMLPQCFPTLGAIKARRITIGPNFIKAQVERTVTSYGFSGERRSCVLTNACASNFTAKRLRDRDDDFCAILRHYRGSGSMKSNRTPSCQPQSRRLGVFNGEVASSTASGTAAPNVRCRNASG
jgi:hypothetical protein